MSAPSVSVVVPCRNGGRFLDGLLANLAQQTFRDLEIVIVDDGSTDDLTRQKLDALPAEVRVVRQERHYLPGARNAGFRAASAELVLPLDCDDELEPTFLAETVPLLRNACEDVGFVFTHMRLTCALEGVLPRHFNRFDQLFLNQLPYCMLMRRSAWEAVGGYDENMHDGLEDWEFNIRLARAGFRGIEVQKPLFIYRVSQGGMLMRGTVRMHGTNWRYIRRKHRELYRVAALVRAAAKRDVSGKVSPITAAALLGMAVLLPESWFNECYFRLFLFNRSQRMARGELQPPAEPLNPELDIRS